MVRSIRGAKTSANELNVDPVSHYTERSEEISFNELLLNMVRPSEPATTTHTHTQGEFSLHDIKYLPSLLLSLMRAMRIMTQYTRDRLLKHTSYKNRKSNQILRADCLKETLFSDEKC